VEVKKLELEECHYSINMAYIGKDLNNLGDVQTLDNITFNAGAGPYNLQSGGTQVTNADTASIMIAIDGVVQGGNYTVNATAGTITFDFSVSSSSVCNFVKLFGTGVQLTPKSNSVSADKLSTTGISAGQVFKVNDAGNGWELGNASSAEVYGFETYFSPSTLTRTVTVAGGKFVIDGVSQDTLDLYEGNTYKFDLSDSSTASHPFRFATAADAAGSTQYTTGVTTSGTQGQAGAYVQIVVAASAPTLYYYCSSHSGMGGTANTPTPANNSLRYITTNQGQDNITESQYANFDDVLFSASGFVFSINTNGNLITTI
jgi:hypothetical protein